MLRVLHDAPAGRAAFSLIFKRWRRQLHASAEELRYRITVRLHRLPPAHVRNISAASQILGPGCATLVVSSRVNTANCLSSLTLKCWCVHPDRIPLERIIFVPEPEPIEVRGPPLFLDPLEIIYHSRSTLRYRTLIEILEVEDWHAGPDSSSNDGGSRAGSHQKCFIRPWLKRVRLDGPVKGADGMDDDAGHGGGAAPSSAAPSPAGRVLLVGGTVIPLPEAAAGSSLSKRCAYAPPAQPVLKGKGFLPLDGAAVYQEPTTSTEATRHPSSVVPVHADPMCIEAAAAEHVKPTETVRPRRQAFEDFPDPIVEILRKVLTAARRWQARLLHYRSAWAARLLSPRPPLESSELQARSNHASTALCC
jgi:hypothetical protein